MHPFAGLVATTIYVPESHTVGFCSVEENPFGPVQLNVTPGVVEFAWSSMQGTKQVISPPTVVTFGGVISWLMGADAELVHPLPGFVTVTT